MMVDLFPTIEYFVGYGLIWALVLSSGPYVWMLERFNLETSPLACAKCTGFWLGMGLSILHGFHPICMVALPLTAEIMYKELV